MWTLPNFSRRLAMSEVKVSRSKSGRETFVTHKGKDGKTTTVVFHKGKKSGAPKVMREKK